jgi:hypothetical protein
MSVSRNDPGFKDVDVRRVSRPCRRSSENKCDLVRYQSMSLQHQRYRHNSRPSSSVEGEQTVTAAVTGPSYSNRSGLNPPARVFEPGLHRSTVSERTFGMEPSSTSNKILDVVPATKLCSDLQRSTSYYYGADTMRYQFMGQPPGYSANYQDHDSPYLIQQLYNPHPQPLVNYVAFGAPVSIYFLPRPSLHPSFSQSVRIPQYQHSTAIPSLMQDPGDKYGIRSVAGPVACPNTSIKNRKISFS